jgi:hypothetical protein
VTGQRNVLDLDVTAIYNSWNTAIAAKLAGRTLAEIGTWGSVNLNFRHVSFFLVVDNGVTDSQIRTWRALA